MRKTRDCEKIIRDAKETFHAKMGTIKDRNGPLLDLTEAEYIKRWQEYTEKKIFTTQLITVMWTFT